MANGTLDPLANAADAYTDFYPAVDALGDVDFLGYQLVRRSHDIASTTPGVDDVLGQYMPFEQCLIDGLVSRTRVTDPARVVYVVDPPFEFTDPATGLNVVHTHAYWVSGLQPRGGDEARIDVSTLTRAVRTTTARFTAGVYQNITSGADLCGPNAGVKTDDVWDYQGMALTPGTAQPVSNGFDATITQFATVALNLRQMGISVTRPITAKIGGDGPTTLTLVGPWRNGQRVAVTRDGVADGTLVAEHGEVILERDFASVTEDVPAVGTVDVSGVEPPAYLNTPVGEISGDQEQVGRVIASHDYVLTPVA
jgi:hypothetical protein